ncbi:MAG TPA: acylneuraminate cytidylyltransferase family protein [Syntrophorhabdaceae bacterium]|nr:acylneuraminate cytidylyltransferase family protein [Syntrophorhabdaceae bacterium]HQM80948.1 acylneuraminate cytidylyltransferase family protein [Syntrophorhabdaceae bacterium]
MYKGRRILAVITARGGSKGLPGKNIKPLLGKPLIVWTIEKALESDYIDRVVVSTDSGDIAAIAKGHGAEVPFKRPKRLSGDRVGSYDVVAHAIEYLARKGDVFDYVALLEPTSPLRKKGDIDRAIMKLVDDEKRADSLVSFGQVTLEHPAVIKKLSSGGFMVPYVKNPEKATGRQGYSPVYFPYGVIYITKISSFYRYQGFYQPRTIPYFVERWQCYEVDDMYDLMAIETILSYRKDDVE